MSIPDPTWRPQQRPATAESNFAHLAVALVLMLFGLALSHELGVVLGPVAVEAALIAVLAAGVWSMRGDRRGHATRLGLLAAVLLLFLIRRWLVHAGLDLAWLGFLLVCLVFSTGSAMRLVLFTGPVDWNKIIGSLCIYLLLGMIWANLYTILADYRQGAFTGLPSGSWYEAFPGLLHFSFITLTTVGYGDITPATDLGRFLAYMEAIVGQFYMAVLVASLVGSVIAERQQ